LVSIARWLRSAQHAQRNLQRESQLICSHTPSMTSCSSRMTFCSVPYHYGTRVRTRVPGWQTTWAIPAHVVHHDSPWYQVLVPWYHWYTCTYHGTIPWYSSTWYLGTYVRTRVPGTTMVVPWYVRTYLFQSESCDITSTMVLEYVRTYVRTYTCTYHGTYTCTYVPKWYCTFRSLSQLAAVYPPKTHVVLSAHVSQVCPFPIRKL
jgi:hypothetical protein